MAYFASFEYDQSNRLTGMDYEHFKLTNKGLNVKTNRGIQPGSSISTVYSKYGQNPIKENTRNPEANYLDLTYPFVLKETNQRGTLTFALSYGKKELETNATVRGIRYLLKDPYKEPQTTPAGMTLSQLKSAWNNEIGSLTDALTYQQKEYLTIHTFSTKDINYQYDFSPFFNIGGVLKPNGTLKNIGISDYRGLTDEFMVAMFNTINVIDKDPNAILKKISNNPKFETDDYTIEFKENGITFQLIEAKTAKGGKYAVFNVIFD